MNIYHKNLKAYGVKRLEAYIQQNRTLNQGLTKICLFKVNDDNFCPLQEYSIISPPSPPVH